MGLLVHVTSWYNHLINPCTLDFNEVSKIVMQVSEILDSELLGKGLIPTLQHAHDKLFFENPETVPYLATTYGQVSILWCLDFRRSMR